MKKKDILSHILDTSMINPTQAEFAYDKVMEMPEEGRLIDVGTGQGHSAMLFGLAKPKWTIYTIDGYGLYGTIQNVWNLEGKNAFSPKGIPTVRSYWKNHGVENIVQIVANSWDMAWELMADVVYIDADHSYKAVEKDVKQFEPFVKEGGLFMFHDYNDTYQVKDYVDENLTGRWNLEERNCLAVLTRK
jgi:predicted O-methyltransferase YrrM